MTIIRSVLLWVDGLSTWSKLGILLLILNEIRGILVVLAVLWAWQHG